MARVTASAGGSLMRARRSTTSGQTSLRSELLPSWPAGSEPPSWSFPGDAADGPPSLGSSSPCLPEITAARNELPRLEVRPVNCKERDRIDEEQDESRDDGR